MKKYMLLILLFCATNLYSQTDILFPDLEQEENKSEIAIAKRIKKYYGKDAVEQYKNFTLKDKEERVKSSITKKVKKYYGKQAAKDFNNFLIIHRLKVEESDIKKIAHQKDVNSAIYSLIKDLRLSRYPYFEVIVYNDSLKVLGIDDGNFVGLAGDKPKALLDYYLNCNVDLLFIANSTFNYFALIGNKIYMLDYEYKTKKLIVSDQW